MLLETYESSILQLKLVFASLVRKKICFIHNVSHPHVAPLPPPVIERFMQIHKINWGHNLRRPCLER